MNLQIRVSEVTATYEYDAAMLVGVPVAQDPGATALAAGGTVINFEARSTRPHAPSNRRASVTRRARRIESEHSW